MISGIQLPLQFRDALLCLRELGRQAISIAGVAFECREFLIFGGQLSLQGGQLRGEMIFIPGAALQGGEFLIFGRELTFRIRQLAR